MYIVLVQFVIVKDSLLLGIARVWLMLASGQERVPSLANCVLLLKQICWRVVWQWPLLGELY